MREHLLILDNIGRRYVLRVRDLPKEEKPREKIQTRGAAALSTPELLAIVLSSGTKKEGVLEMAARVMHDYGEKGIMCQKDPAQLAKELGLPAVKAAQIVACAELGRRFFEKNEVERPVLRTAREVYEYVKDMRDLSKEQLRGIYLNAHYKVIHDEVVSMGTIDTNIVHPREVFKPAVEYAASGLILVHNHPSGSTEPSEADIETTEQLVKAGNLLGISLIDHIIITRGEYKSIPVNY
jgi:DNA repair protein RadC